LAALSVGRPSGRSERGALIDANETMASAFPRLRGFALRELRASWIDIAR